MNQVQATSFLWYALQPFGYRKSATAGSLQLKCYYINNANETVRWIWPAKSHTPHFLRFYFTGTWKSKLHALLVKLMFALGLQRYLSHGECTLSFAPGHIDELNVVEDEWALFTGTQGPNRKLVLYLHKKGGEFVKIPYGEFAFSILQKEEAALLSLQNHSFQSVIIPRLTASAKEYLAQQNIGAGMWPAPVQWLQLPQQAMQEWCFHGLVNRNVTTSSSSTQIAARLQRLQSMPHSRIPAGLILKLQQLFAHASQWDTLHESPAHGDCTPWNMLMNQHQVALIDLELYKPQAPALYDAFHYHYQTGILIGNQGFRAIRKSIDSWTLNWEPLLQQKNLNTRQLEQWYLLDVVSYYTELYAHQQDWHIQINWLLQTWSDALSYWLLQSDAIADRSQLLADLSDWLQTKPHAALKMHLPHILLLPVNSDVDVCMTENTANDMLQWLQQHPLCKQIIRRRRSNMVQVAIYLHSGNVLHIDAIWQLKRKSYEFMNVAAILDAAINDGRGIRVAHVQHDILYTWLFYVLNGAEVPERYQAYWKQLPSSDLDSVHNTIKAYTHHQEISAALLHPSLATSHAATGYVAQLPANRGVKRLINFIQYYIDMIRDWKNNRGFIITFSGVDGAGKSTIIEATREHVEKVMRKRVVVLRHRPSLLPILSAWKHGKEAAEKKAAQTLPRQGTNKSSLGSILRFAYYYADYLLGQFYIQIKYVMRGYVVLYDRYYFDFINDSKRSNIQLPKFITTAGYALLLKPKLNFFLWATPEEILSRKQELNAETIVSLTKDYMQLFDGMRKRYKYSSYEPIHNQQLNQTLQTIFQQIQATA